MNNTGITGPPKLTLSIRVLFGPRNSAYAILDTTDIPTYIYMYIYHARAQLELGKSPDPTRYGALLNEVYFCEVKIHYNKKD